MVEAKIIAYMCKNIQASFNLSCSNVFSNFSNVFSNLTLDSINSIKLEGPYNQP
jgi:hypothetical protein